MPEFEYKVVTSAGKVQTGTSKQFTNEEALKADLRSQGFSILEIQEKKAVAKAKSRGFSFEPFGVSPKALSFFTRQYAATLRAGLPTLRALATLQNQTSSNRLASVLGDITNQIKQGQSMHQAFSRHRNTFGDLYLSLIRVGEATGGLDVCVARLAELMDKDLKLQRKIKAALSYPMFVLIFSALIVYGLVAFLLPAFTPVFMGAGLNIEKDYPITAILVKMSHVFTNPFLMTIVITVCILMYVGIRLLEKVEAGKLFMDTIKYHVPLFHKLIEMAALARFCRTFGILIKSGVPLLEGLTYVAGAAGNAYVARSIQKVSHDVQEGGKISSVLANIPLFPPLLVQMASIGEETGNLDVMFERIAEFYEEELDAAISALTSLIEPLMMAFVGAVVCFFVLGILLPILGISMAVQKQM
ncbi:MAG TPA: type II secretion system F family protein [Candidatus Xenobia bacterium]|jgi:type IV pilus assembly protein PilC